MLLPRRPLNGVKGFNEKLTKLAAELALEQGRYQDTLEQHNLAKQELLGLQKENQQFVLATEARDDMKHQLLAAQQERDEALDEIQAIKDRYQPYEYDTACFIRLTQWPGTSSKILRNNGNYSLERHCLLSKNWNVWKP